MPQIGVIGAGLAVRELHVPALDAIGRLADVRMIATSSPETASEAANWMRDRGASQCIGTSVEALLASNEIDVVLVAVPIARTTEMAARVIAAGKAALIEKPIATTTQDARRLVEQASEAGLPILAGENFRFRPEYKRMRELAADGAIGELRVVYWNDLHYTPATGKYAETAWRIEGEHRGGYLVDGGTHIVAGFRQLSNAEILGVHGLALSSQRYLSNQADTLIMNIRFDDGTAGHLALGYGLFDPEARHPKLCGDKATLALMKDGIYRVDQAGSAKVEDLSPPTDFADQWTTLLDAISREPSAIEAVRALTAESVRDLHLLESALASSESGEYVALSPLF